MNSDLEIAFALGENAGAGYVPVVHRMRDGSIISHNRLCEEVGADNKALHDFSDSVKQYRYSTGQRLELMVAEVRTALV